VSRGARLLVQRSVAENIFGLLADRCCLNQRKDTNDLEELIVILWAGGGGGRSSCSVFGLFRHFEGTYCSRLQIAIIWFRLIMKRFRYEKCVI
jgi:hypothetical protein